jgi:hypothetical protein
MGKNDIDCLTQYANNHDGGCMKRWVLFATMMISLNIYAAGAISGGGGKAVVCRDSNQKIISAETLDLYEGRVLYNLNIPSSPLPMWQLVDRALQVVDDRMIYSYTYNVRDGMQIVHGSDLQPIDDDAAVAAPHNCRLEQVANYFTDTKILINGDIWDQMSPTSQAALILHEAVYKVDRMVGAKNSFRSRHVVASLFDPATKWESPHQDWPDKNYYFCSTGDQADEFAIYKDSSNAWIVQFQSIANQEVVSKKSCVLGTYGNGLSDLSSPIIPGEDKIGPAIVGGGSCGLTSKFEDQDFIDIEVLWDVARGDWGKVIKGYEMPVFNISWGSRTYPWETYSYKRKPFFCMFLTQ